MITMESALNEPMCAESMSSVPEEDGEILEDGEIEDDAQNSEHSEKSAADATENSKNNVAVEYSVFENGDDNAAAVANCAGTELAMQEVEVEAEESEAEDPKKHHKRSHSHKRRKKRTDAEVDDKKARHKKRKGEELSDADGNSPGLKRKKKRKKHSRERKHRNSSSPEQQQAANFLPPAAAAAADYHQTAVDRGSVSPPLPSEQSAYDYSYDAVADQYDGADPYNPTLEQASKLAAEYLSQAATEAGYRYGAADETYADETYQYAQQKDEHPSTGSDSYYSDFESHLQEYKSYKSNLEQGGSNKATAAAGSRASDDDESFYGVSYDPNSDRRQRRRQRSDLKSSSSSSSRTQRNSRFERNRRHSSRQQRGHERHNDATICKYYREGHCTKGDKCSYSHNISYGHSYGHERTKKIPELCRHYLSGSCHKGSTCHHLHDDYPCKDYHVAMNCPNGDQCNFSHQAPTDMTKGIIRRWREMFNSMDDSAELLALEKAGIKPLEKPPPGKGLLPTPSSSELPLNNSAYAGSKSSSSGKNQTSKSSSLPSLFDISVKPTRELQDKLDTNCEAIEQDSRAQVLALMSSVASLNMPDDPATAGSMPAMPPPMNVYDRQTAAGGPGLLPFPPPPVSSYDGTSMLLGRPMMTTFPHPHPGNGLLGPAPSASAGVIGGAGMAWSPQDLHDTGLAANKHDSKGFYDNYYSQLEREAAEAEQVLNSTETEEKDDAKEFWANNSSVSNSSINSSSNNDERHHRKERARGKEDVIRMDDQQVINADLDTLNKEDVEVKAPDFLPAKQKALFMRINQKRSLSTELSTADAKSKTLVEDSTDHWTYSSDEEDRPGKGALSSNSVILQQQQQAPTPVQSIIQMISNKRDVTNVDTNLLSKVAGVINMPAAVTSTASSASLASKKPPMTSTKTTTMTQSHRHNSMSSPAHSTPAHLRTPPNANPDNHVHVHNGSGSDSSSPAHPGGGGNRLHHHSNPIRRRLSTSELNKEPLVIPLVAKQSTADMNSAHPDPRVTLSRLFGLKKMQFRAAPPRFGKDAQLTAAGLSTLKPHVALKATMSADGFDKATMSDSSGNGDPRAMSRHKSSGSDPRIKAKAPRDDPRLRNRANSKSPSHHAAGDGGGKVTTPYVPQTPAALLTKPPSAAIPSLPELNLDMAKPEQRRKPANPPPPANPLPAPKKKESPARLPKLQRAQSDFPSAAAKTPQMLNAKSSSTVAPYDPRYITTAAASTRTALTTKAPASASVAKLPPKDPRVLSSTPPHLSVPQPPPQLFDPRSTKLAPNKLPQLPKLTPAPPRLTPAPGYVIKSVTTTSPRELPSGEQVDF